MYEDTCFCQIFHDPLESYMLGNLTSGPFSVPKSSSSDAEFSAEHAHINISIFSKIRVTGLCQMTLEIVSGLKEAYFKLRYSM